MMRKKIIKKKFTKKDCFFCQKKHNPGYREFEELRRFTSERGKIHPRSRSGICAKHQKKLALAIKRARHLALLPFSESL